MNLQDEFRETLRAELAPIEAKLAAINDKLNRLLQQDAFQADILHRVQALERKLEGKEN